MWILFPSTAPPYACLYLARYLPSPFLLNWPEGLERRWQGSLHHKTPSGHCPQTLPHNITTTLSTNKWTGPVCHSAGTGRERQRKRKREGEVEEREREKVMRKTEERGKTGMRDQKERERWEKKNRRGPVCLQGPNHNYSHAEILDICISMTQIMFAWTQKDCIKSKVEEVWWMSDWSLPPQSFILLPVRPGISVFMWCHPHPTPKLSFLHKHDPFVGSQEDKPSLVLLLAHQHFA